MNLPKIGKEWRYGCLYCREECQYKLADRMSDTVELEPAMVPAIVRIRPDREVSAMIKMWYESKMRYEKALRKEKREIAKLPVLQVKKIDQRALKHSIKEKRIAELHKIAIQEESNRRYASLVLEQKAIPFDGPFHAESKKQIYGVKRQGIVRDALRAIFQIKKVVKATSKRAVHHERMEIHKMSPLSRVDSREYSKEEMNYFLAMSLKEVKLRKEDVPKIVKLKDGRYRIVVINGVKYLQNA
jgi:hypothetical protein